MHYGMSFAVLFVLLENQRPFFWQRIGKVKRKRLEARKSGEELLHLDTVENLVSSWFLLKIRILSANKR